MMSEDKLMQLAQAAGYSLLPPQELFTASVENTACIEKTPEPKRNQWTLYSKVKARFYSVSTSCTSSVRNSVISWIQSHVHV